MDNDSARARPSRKRPRSRASTTSVQSIATQSLDTSGFGDAAALYGGQWPETGQVTTTKDMGIASVAHPLPPEELILQAANHLQTGHDFRLEHSLGPPMVHTLSYHSHSLPNASFADSDSQMLDRDDNEEGDSGVGASGPQKSGSRSSANNELEMRNLFNASKYRSLQDVAGELHGNERGPHSERARQVFAMLWINSVCSKGKGSVPRGRVYANYASRCATERITVLNPASFGKLVRVLFPGLKTRRLGVRGESKYHYVQFNLVDDQPDTHDPPPPPPPSLGPALQEVTQPFTYILPANAPQQNQQQLPLQNPPQQPPPPPQHQQQHQQHQHQQHHQHQHQHQQQQHHQHQHEQQQQQQQQHQQQQQQQQQPSKHVSPTGEVPPPFRLIPSVKPSVAGSDRSHSLYNRPDILRMDAIDSTATKTELGLCFPPVDEEAWDSRPLILPPIEPFLPQGTDADAAKSLAALYRSHCTSLVECIRYCKEKTFFHLYTSFQGTLTLPVQRLMGKPSVAPWIEQCDFILYQRMMLLISTLTLQVLPHPVLETLRSIAERLVGHVRQSFQGQPQHVIAAKEAPAILFAGLIDRTLRVNLAAHAAANMLANVSNRNEMYLEWISLIRARKIAEVVPTRGMDDVVKLLICEIRYLLNPSTIPWEVEATTVYGEVPMRDQLGGGGDSTDDVANGQNVLDRWVTLLKSLPSRFPYASHADLVWCVERIGTAVMRDITISSGKSFGSWWVTKTWIDEMVWFLAEHGAFMKLTSTRTITTTTTTTTRTARAATPEAAAVVGPDCGGIVDETAEQRWARLASNDGDDVHLLSVASSGIMQAQPDRAPFPSSAMVIATANHDHDHHHQHQHHNCIGMVDNASLADTLHDDSGIGSEEDFRVDGKFPLSTAESGSVQALAASL